MNSKSRRPTHRFSPSKGRSAGSGNTGNKSSNKHVRECTCGRGLACIGMTQAFRLLGDPRCYYVELPRYKKNPPAYKYKFRNHLREAYLRHLKAFNPTMDMAGLESSSQRRYVALHHFHPAVVKAFYENPLTSGAAQKHKVPISITEHELQELNMDIHHEDRILSVTGVPTGGYYFCPSYQQGNAHEDLKHLIKLARADREANEKKKALIVPQNIEISTKPSKLESPSTPLSVSSTPKETEKEPTRAAQESETTENVDLGRILRQPLSPRLQKTPPKTAPTKGDTNAHEASEKTQVDPEDSRGGQSRDFDDLVSAGFDALWAEDNSAHPAKSDLPTTIIDDAAAEPEPEPEPEPDQEKAAISEDTEKLERIDDVHIETSTRQDDPEVSGRGESERAFESTATVEEVAQSEATSPIRKTSSRDTDHPWQTPKYRRHLEKEKQDSAKRSSSAPAQFIDPTIASPLRDKAEITDDGGSDAASIGHGEIKVEEKSAIVPVSRPVPSEAASVAQKSAAAISAAALSAMKSIDEVEETSKEHAGPSSSTRQSGVFGEDPPGWVSQTQATAGATGSSIHRNVGESKSWEDIQSQGSNNSVGTGVMHLSHHFPGTDPTLRIQVHNDLIAWESKRRSEMSNFLDLNKEKWHAIREILREGNEEIDFAERFILGFAKAGNMFADSIESVNDDKFLDDAGNTVSNSFLKNRLYKKRVTQEYSIETQDDSADSGQSALLNSILEAQVEIANTFRGTAEHIENEILPELLEIRADIQGTARQMESLGDNIISELTRSEIELKSIWDVFDAMVTGDLMEYTVHGSMHGSQHGSQHGGSMHSSFGNSTGSSLHGFMTPRDGDGPIVSSLHSPLVKSAFRQLGAVEDGWLVEMYYRSAAVYQRAVFGIAENELNNLTKGIAALEERRFRKLHQVMLAFVPRQRRLFNALPEQLKQVLNDLVGLRIDEDSLQTLIDESIKDRSHDHLKRGASHRSAIMNRSRVSKAKEAADAEVEAIELSFGNPFKSSMVLLSKVVEIQPGGLRGIVNFTWKAAMVVVTSEGNFHVFTLPDNIDINGMSPSEAFKALYPTMDFESPASWARKAEIVKSLTPTLTLNLKISQLLVPNMQARQLQVVEDASNGGGARNRFMKAMKAAADSQRGKKCTLRLVSASEVTEWMTLLERSKKVLRSKDDSGRGPRFKF